jgi:hypothetical protein
MPPSPKSNSKRNSFTTAEFQKALNLPPALAMEAFGKSFTKS